VTAAVIVAAILAVIAVLLALSMLRSRAAASAATRSGEDRRRELDAAEKALADSRAEAEDLRSTMAQLQRSSEQMAEPSPGAGLTTDRSRTPDTMSGGAPSERVTSAGAAPGSVDAAGAPTLAALWALTRIRQEWTSRQSAILSLEEEPPEGRWVAATLEQVLDEEVSRIREDTGTPGTLRTSLPHEPSAAQSVLLITSLQALLDALSRHCQGYDLYVHEWERRLTAIVVCDGFDGPDRVASDATSVLAAIAPAGGDLALDRDSKGRLRARLSLAVSTPA
jgi:Tfp pilus assembly protein PilX